MRLTARVSGVSMKQQPHVNRCFAGNRNHGLKTKKQIRILRRSISGDSEQRQAFDCPPVDDVLLDDLGNV